MGRDVKNRKLGDAVRKARLAKKLSGKALAELLGIDNSTITYLEQGVIDKPNVKTLKALSRELDIPLDDLFALSGYARKESLPALPVYLRSKYGLSAREAAEIEGHFRRLQARRGEKGGGREKRAR